MLRIRPATIGILFVFGPAGAAAQFNPPHVQASRMSKPPIIDGKVDPDEWAGANHLTQFVDPYTNLPTKDQTEAYLGYDRSAIYVAFVCHDSEPGRVVGREIHPGSDLGNEDTVTLRINPFGTRGWDGISRFTVNPLGTQNDDIAVGRAAKREWRGEWQSASIRTNDGWSAEFRIPWKVLNYPRKKILSMDLNLERYQARTLIRSQWSNTSIADRPEFSGFWDAVEPPSASAGKRLQFLAYTAPEYDEGNISLRSGFDVRYAVTPTLTALASINPDFRNIESQIAGVDFTRVERYLNEPRPFFNEGSGFFGLTPDFSFGQMFYSQRIVNFDYGAKSFWQITPNLSVGTLTTVQSGIEAASVTRIAETFGPKANASVFAVRDDMPGQINNSYGLNAWGRRGSFSSDVEFASEQTQGKQVDTASSVSVAYDVPKIFIITRGEWVPKDFAPPLAYIPWTDRSGYYNYADYGSQFRHGTLRQFDINTYTTNYRTFAGALQQRGTDYNAYGTTDNDLGINLSRSNTRYADGLDSVTGLGVTFNQSNRYKKYGFYYETGERSSQPSNYLNLNASLRIWNRLDLGASFSALKFGGSDSQAIVTVGSELSKTQSITGRFVQHNGKENYYLAFRNGGSSGTELYVILGDPNSASETFHQRASVKLVWAF